MHTAARKAGRRVGTLLVGAVVLSLAAGPAPAKRQTFPGPNGSLAFGHSSSVIVVEPDGSGQHTVIGSASGLPAAGPDWSANGNRIAFAATAGTTPGIWWVTADGKTKTRVTTKQNDKMAAWSPDGTKIAFVRNDTGQDRLFVVNVDGTGERSLTAGQALNVAEPEWSPDGTKFAFSNGFRIYTMGADGSNPQLITGIESGNATYPSWSPDGTRIAFKGSGGIRVVQPDGGGKALLVPLTGEVWDVSWSPDGTKLAFVQDVIGPFQEELWTANADGTGITRLNVDSDTTVDWGVRGTAAATGTAILPPMPIPPPTGSATGTVLVYGKPFTVGTVPYNATVDVTKGAITLKTTAGSITLSPAGGKPAAFVLRRGTENGTPIVEFGLAKGDFSLCPKRKTRSARAAPPKIVRQLWGNGKGRFRTKGRFAAATVRGTRWLTSDRCDGTLTRVTRGVVQVTDLRTKKQFTVRAGKSHLSKP